MKGCQIVLEADRVVHHCFGVHPHSADLHVRNGVAVAVEKECYGETPGHQLVEGLKILGIGHLFSRRPPEVICEPGL